MEYELNFSVPPWRIGVKLILFMYRSNSMPVCSLPHGIVLSTALHPLLCLRYGWRHRSNSDFAGTEPDEAPYAKTGIITHDGNDTVKFLKPCTAKCFSI